nr:MAG TPA: hypothetical protein [Caudoviricetes sp.]
MCDVPSCCCHHVASLVLWFQSQGKGPSES